MKILSIAAFIGICLTGAAQVPPTQSLISSNVIFVDTNNYVFVPIKAELHTNIWTVTYGCVESNIAQSIITVNVTNSPAAQALNQVQLAIPMLISQPYKTNLNDTIWQWETTTWWCYRTDNIANATSKFYRSDVKMTLLPP